MPDKTRTPPMGLRSWILPTYTEEERDKLPLEFDKNTAARIYLHRLFVVSAVLVLDILLLGVCKILGVGGSGLVVSGVLMLFVPFLLAFRLNKLLFRSRRKNK
jgi:hypothetical protein